MCDVLGDVTAQVALQPALKFNGGGHINHTIFWTNLSPNGGGEPQGKLEVCVSVCLEEVGMGGGGGMKLTNQNYK